MASRHRDTGSGAGPSCFPYSENKLRIHESNISAISTRWSDGSDTAAISCVYLVLFERQPRSRIADQKPGSGDEKAGQGKTAKEEMRELLGPVKPKALRERLLKVWAKW